MSRAPAIFQRFVAIFVLICFMGTQSPVAFAQTPSAKSLSMPQKVDPRQVQVPEEIGQVLETSSESTQKTVILIQDAHSVPEAQRNLQKLIEHFQKEYGVQQVVFEGASTKLDPQILKSYPDPEQLKKVFEDYYERGELTGVTAAAVLSPHPSTYQGIENWQTYQKGLGLYLAAQEEKQELLEALKKEKEQLKQKKSEVYSEELLEIDRAIMGFQEDPETLSETLEILSRYQTPNLDHLELYMKSLKGSFLRTELQINLDQKTYELYLKEKLVQLKLTRDEWEVIKQLSVLSNTYAWQFYLNAEKREEEMFLNFPPLTRTSSRPLPEGEGKGEGIIFITGGFHTPALIQKFKENKTAYVLIRPTMTAVPEDLAYQQQMKGEVSWESYFEFKQGRISLYDAFVRAVRDKLLSLTRPPKLVAGRPLPQGEGRGEGVLIKSWRDRIIQDLALQNRIHQSQNYTKYLDEVLEPTHYPQKIRDFVGSLHKLEAQNQFTPENILKLFQPATMVAARVSGQMSGDFLIPEDRLLLRAKSESRSDDLTDFSESSFELSLRGLESFDHAVRQLRAHKFEKHNQAAAQIAKLVRAGFVTPEQASRRIPIKAFRWKEDAFNVALLHFKSVETLFEAGILTPAQIEEIEDPFSESEFFLEREEDLYLLQAKALVSAMKVGKKSPETLDRPRIKQALERALTSQFTKIRTSALKAIHLLVKENIFEGHVFEEAVTAHVNAPKVFEVDSSENWDHMGYQEAVFDLLTLGLLPATPETVAAIKAHNPFSPSREFWAPRAWQWLLEKNLFSQDEWEKRIPLGMLTVQLLYSGGEDAANILKRLVEKGWYTKEEIRAKLQPDHLINRFLSTDSPLFKETAGSYSKSGGVLSTLLDAGILSVTDIDPPANKPVISKRVLSSASNPHREQDLLNYFSSSGYLTQKELFGYSAGELMALHKSQRFQDKPVVRARLLHAKVLITGEVSDKDVKRLKKIIDETHEDTDGFFEMLRIMASWTLRKSNDTQNYLDGKVEKALSKKLKGRDRYLKFTKRERFFIEAVKASRRLTALLPFAYRADLKPKDRGEVMTLLAERSYIDKFYKEYHDPKTLKGVSQFYREQGFIPPAYWVTLRASNAQKLGGVRLPDPNSPISSHLLDLRKKHPYRSLLSYIANSAGVDSEYYLRHQSPFSYPGIPFMAFHRFDELVRKARDHLSQGQRNREGMDRLLVALETAYGESQSVSEIFAAMQEGRFPLPDQSPYWDDQKRFIPQKVMELEGGGELYLDSVDKRDLIEMARLTDGTSCCMTTLPENPNMVPSVNDVHVQNMASWIADETSFFFQVTTGKRTGKQVGFLQVWFSLDAEGKPMVGSSLFYMNAGFRDSKIVDTLYRKADEILFSLPITQHALYDNLSAETPSAIHPSKDYERKTVNATRIFSLRPATIFFAADRIMSGKAQEELAYVRANPRDAASESRAQKQEALFKTFREVLSLPPEMTLGGAQWENDPEQGTWGKMKRFQHKGKDVTNLIFHDDENDSVGLRATIPDNEAAFSSDAHSCCLASVKLEPSANEKGRLRLAHLLTNIRDNKDQGFIEANSEIIFRAFKDLPSYAASDKPPIVFIQVPEDALTDSSSWHRKLSRRLQQKGIRLFVLKRGVNRSAIKYVDSTGIALLNTSIQKAFFFPEDQEAALHAQGYSSEHFSTWFSFHSRRKVQVILWEGLETLFERENKNLLVYSFGDPSIGKTIAAEDWPAPMRAWGHSLDGFRRYDMPGIVSSVDPTGMWREFWGYETNPEGGLPTFPEHPQMRAFEDLLRDPKTRNVFTPLLREVFNFFARGPRIWELYEYYLKHLGFYPGGSGHPELEASVQALREIFDLDHPALITESFFQHLRQVSTAVRERDEDVAGVFSSMGLNTITLAISASLWKVMARQGAADEQKFRSLLDRFVSGLGLFKDTRNWIRLSFSTENIPIDDAEVDELTPTLDLLRHISRSEARLHVSHGESHMATKPHEDLEALLECCFVVVGHDRETGNRFMGHLLPTGHLVDDEGSPTHGSIEGKKAYVDRVLKPLRESGQWDVALVSYERPEDAAYPRSDFILDASDIEESLKSIPTIHEVASHYGRPDLLIPIEQQQLWIEKLVKVDDKGILSISYKVGTEIHQGFSFPLTRSESRYKKHEKLLTAFREILSLPPETTIGEDRWVSDLSKRSWGGLTSFEHKGKKVTNLIFRDDQSFEFGQRGYQVTFPLDEGAYSSDAHTCCLASVKIEPSEDHNGFLRLAHLRTSYIEEAGERNLDRLNLGPLLDAFIDLPPQPVSSEKAPIVFLQIPENAFAESSQWHHTLNRVLQKKGIRLFILKRKPFQSAIKYVEATGVAILSTYLTEMSFFDESTISQLDKMGLPESSHDYFWNRFSFRSGRKVQVILWEELEALFEKENGNLLVYSFGDESFGETVEAEDWPAPMRSWDYSADPIFRDGVMQSILTQIDPTNVWRHFWGLKDNGSGLPTMPRFPKVGAFEDHLRTPETRNLFIPSMGLFSEFSSEAHPTFWEMHEYYLKNLGLYPNPNEPELQEAIKRLHDAFDLNHEALANASSLEQFNQVLQAIQKESPEVFQTLELIRNHTLMFILSTSVWKILVRYGKENQKRLEVILSRLLLREDPSQDVVSRMNRVFMLSDIQLTSEETLALTSILEAVAQSESRAMIPVRQGKSHLATQENEEMDITLQCCLAVVGYDTESGHRFVGHFLPTGHLVDENSKIVSATEEGKKAYIHKILQELKNAGGSWNVLLVAYHHPSRFNTGEPFFIIADDVTEILESMENVAEVIEHSAYPELSIEPNNPEAMDKKVHVNDQGDVAISYVVEGETYDGLTLYLSRSEGREEYPGGREEEQVIFSPNDQYKMSLKKVRKQDHHDVLIEHESGKWRIHSAAYNFKKDFERLQLTYDGEKLIASIDPWNAIVFDVRTGKELYRIDGKTRFFERTETHKKKKVKVRRDQKDFYEQLDDYVTKIIHRKIKQSNNVTNPDRAARYRTFKVKILRSSTHSPYAVAAIIRRALSAKNQNLEDWNIQIEVYDFNPSSIRVIEKGRYPVSEMKDFLSSPYAPSLIFESDEAGGLIETEGYVQVEEEIRSWIKPKWSALYSRSTEISLESEKANVVMAQGLLREFQFAEDSSLTASTEQAEVEVARQRLSEFVEKGSWREKGYSGFYSHDQDGASHIAGTIPYAYLDHLDGPHITSFVLAAKSLSERLEEGPEAKWKEASLESEAFEFGMATAGNQPPPANERLKTKASRMRFMKQIAKQLEPIISLGEDRNSNDEMVLGKILEVGSLLIEAKAELLWLIALDENEYLRGPILSLYANYEELQLDKESVIIQKIASLFTESAHVGGVKGTVKFRKEGQGIIDRVHFNPMESEHAVYTVTFVAARQNEKPRVEVELTAKESISKGRRKMVSRQFVFSEDKDILILLNALLSTSVSESLTQKNHGGAQAVTYFQGLRDYWLSSNQSESGRSESRALVTSGDIKKRIGALTRHGFDDSFWYPGLTSSFEADHEDLEEAWQRAIVQASYEHRWADLKRIVSWREKEILGIWSNPIHDSETNQTGLILADSGVGKSTIAGLLYADFKFQALSDDGFLLFFESKQLLGLGDLFGREYEYGDGASFLSLPASGFYTPDFLVYLRGESKTTRSATAPSSLVKRFIGREALEQTYQKRQDRKAYRSALESLPTLSVGIASLTVYETASKVAEWVRSKGRSEIRAVAQLVSGILLGQEQKSVNYLRAVSETIYSAGASLFGRELYSAVDMQRGLIRLNLGKTIDGIQETLVLEDRRLIEDFRLFENSRDALQGILMRAKKSVTAQKQVIYRIPFRGRAVRSLLSRELDALGWNQQDQIQKAITQDEIILYHPSQSLHIANDPTLTLTREPQRVKQGLAFNWSEYGDGENVNYSGADAREVAEGISTSALLVAADPLSEAVHQLIVKKDGAHHSANRKALFEADWALDYAIHLGLARAA